VCILSNEVHFKLALFVVLYTHAHTHTDTSANLHCILKCQIISQKQHSYQLIYNVIPFERLKNRFALNDSGLLANRHCNLETISFLFFFNPLKKCLPNLIQVSQIDENDLPGKI